MKEAINFLKTLYSESVKDIATILVAEAEGDKEVIKGYLRTVQNYVSGLINKL